MPVATALDNARVRAERAAAADASELTGRPRAVAAAEAAALGRPDCRCVVALVVDGDRAGLDAVARRTPVRAVEAAPPGTTERRAGALAAAAGADGPRGPAAGRRPGAAGPDRAAPIGTDRMPRSPVHAPLAPRSPASRAAELPLPHRVLVRAGVVVPERAQRRRGDRDTGDAEHAAADDRPCGPTSRPPPARRVPPRRAGPPCRTASRSRPGVRGGSRGSSGARSSPGTAR